MDNWIRASKRVRTVYGKQSPLDLERAAKLPYNKEARRGARRQSGSRVSQRGGQYNGLQEGLMANTQQGPQGDL